MRKKMLIAAMLVFAMTLTFLAGCSLKTEAPAAEEAAAAEAPADDETAAVESEEGAYTYESSVTVDGGRVLKLVLHGTELGGERYVIRKIDVLDGETAIQTIDIAEATAIEWGEEYQTEGAETYTKDGGVCAADMNFDGAEDIGIIGWVTAGANVPYYYWLWNAEKEQFEYAFCLVDPYPDETTHRVISGNASGAGCYIIDSYEYAADGSLTLAKREVMLAGADEQESAAIAKLLREIAEHYYPGTAGCSLVSAKYAGELLDWYVGTEQNITLAMAAAAAFYWELEGEAQELYLQQLNDIYLSALALTEGDPTELLETAGYAPEYAPWERADAELLFAGLYSGLGKELTTQE